MTSALSIPGIHHPVGEQPSADHRAAKFGALRTGEETVMPNWVFMAFSVLTLASDLKVLAFLAQHRLYQRGTFQTWEIAGQTGLDLRTVQASTRRLAEAGYIVGADSEHCLRGACAKPAHPLHKSTRLQTVPKPRQDSKKPPLEVKEGIEVKEIEKKERECIGGNVTPPGHSLSVQNFDFFKNPTAQQPGGASAEAPVGASAAPAPTVTAAQAPPEAQKSAATSTETVPGGAAAGSARTALQTIFGRAFLGQLLAEAPGRAGWLGLEVPRIAELHQGAFAAAGEKSWRTLLIAALEEDARKANVQFTPAARALTTGTFAPGQRVSYKREAYTVEHVTDTFIDLYDEVNGSSRVLLASSDWSAVRAIGGQA